jgi:chaperonin GroES
MKIRPLGDRVLVKREDAEERTASGIYIPDTAKEKPTKALVRAVGPGRITHDGTRVEMNVKVGDTILFGKYSGSEIEVDGEKLLMVTQDEILGVIEK